MSGIPLFSGPRNVFSVSIYLRHAGAVLLVEHVREAKWLPLGGKMHSGEIPLEAAMRECFEESGRMATFPSSPTGIAGAPDGFVGYQEHRAEPSGLLTLNFNFVADLPDRTIIPCAEYRNFRWFTPDAIASFEGEMPTHVAQVALMAMHFPERALPPRQRR